MNKLEYIPGDLVYIHGSLRIVSNCDGYYATYYDENESLQEVNVNVIEGIPITPEILEKNGWKNLMVLIHIGLIRWDCYKRVIHGILL